MRYQRRRNRRPTIERSLRRAHLFGLSKQFPTAAFAGRDESDRGAAVPSIQLSRADLASAMELRRSRLEVRPLVEEIAITPNEKRAALGTRAIVGASNTQ